MKTPPKINLSTLKQAIFNNWGLRVKSMKFIPKGESSYGYVLKTDKGKYFLKIHLKKLIKKLGRRFDFSLKASSDFYTESKIKNISYPLPNKNKDLKTIYNNEVLTLYPFISGRNANNWNLNKEESKSLGELLAKIHNSTPKIKATKEQLEESKFGKSPDFKSQFFKIFRELKQNKKLNTPSKKELAKIILPEENLFRSTYSKLIALNRELAKQKIEFVISHRDPIESNLIFKNNQASLIDWDGVGFVPKEQDLWFHLREPNAESFLKGYESVNGKFKLNSLAIEYHIIDRILEDFIDWADNLLYEKHSEKFVKYMLKQIKEYIIKDLNTLDRRMIKINKIVDNWNKRA